MRILLTGATGFVGGGVLPELLKKHEVYCVVRNENLLLFSEIILWDMADLSQPMPSLPDVDVVIHLAQGDKNFPEYANTLFAVNTLATQLLVDHAFRCGAQRFIYASTGNVYKTTTQALKEDAPLEASNYYVSTKLGAENFLRQYRAEMDILILRLFVPFGPGQENRLLPKLIERVVRGQTITLKNGGQPSVTPIFIDDLTNVFQSFLTLQGSHILNVAGKESLSIKDITTLAGNKLGIEPLYEYQENEHDWNLIADIERFGTVYDMREMLSFEQGLERVLASRGLLDG